jgi:hypothetical protein
LQLLIREGGFEVRPTREAVLQGERVLQIAQAGFTGRFGIHAAQTRACLCVAGPQRFQPLLRFLLETSRLVPGVSARLMETFLPLIA